MHFEIRQLSCISGVLFPYPNYSVPNILNLVTNCNLILRDDVANSVARPIWASKLKICREDILFKKTNCYTAIVVLSRSLIRPSLGRPRDGLQETLSVPLIILRQLDLWLIFSVNGVGSIENDQTKTFFVLNDF